jgi:hypothetical protein
MCKQIVIATIFIGACRLAAAEQADVVKPGGVITKSGEYKASDGKLAFKILEADGTLTLIFTRSSKPKNNVVVNLPPKKGAFWLVYPEIPNKVWLFRAPDLVELELTDQGGNSRTYTGSKVVKVAPKTLLDALPKEVLEKLKSK